MAFADQDLGARSLLMAAYRAAYATALPEVCVPPYLPAVPPHLPGVRVRGRLILLGAGKANAAMAVATEAHYGALGVLDRIEGFVTTRHGFALPTQRIEVVEAAHPVPDAASALAAERALALASEAGADDVVLVLMSGGASALWSAPVAGVSADDKQALTRQLLRSGAPIGDMNIVRRHLSRIKGGRLARAAHRAQVITLAISDVPGDVPEAIGSGPTVGDNSTLADARAVLARYGITPPDAVARALMDAANETVKPDDPALARARFHMVARPGAALEAAADVVRRAGYAVTLLGDALEGEARDVGRQHGALALAARSRGERVAILSGGEFTVTVVGTGAGGPNQEYAMGLALGLGGASGIAALAADTDGIDGGGGLATDPAGAIVLPDTLARARSCHMDAEQMLGNNDSTAFFKTLGDLVEVGPTQTNVNDFRLILVDP